MDKKEILQEIANLVVDPRLSEFYTKLLQIHDEIMNNLDDKDPMIPCDLPIFDHDDKKYDNRIEGFL